MLTVIACPIGLTAAIVCWRAWHKLHHATLSAPCAWAGASLALVTCAAGLPAVAGGSSGANWTAHVDYLASITTLAPFVALLGAKRPQDRAWQLIVAALVALFAFQDFRTWAIDPSTSPTPHAAWRWLTTGLVVMQLLNYLATLHAAAACLAFAGQACLLRDNLVVPSGDSGELIPYGLILVSTAVFAAALRERGTHNDAQGAWLKFRDRYGALWALRVAERVNAVAAQQNSPFRLRWSGFRLERFDTEQPADRQPSLDADPVSKTLQAILARFVSAG
ncbi:MAG TPA: hypothetical protein VG125_09925 [Pirellulales bacterium]|jgi:hypothetical protein|nr:hypothetical protein [Pirellulales bacterium]